jgi:N-acetylglutamate synthase-like GNAT family acetyltransferase
MSRHMTRTVTIRQATSADTAALDRLFQRSYMTLMKAHYPPSSLVCCLPIVARAQPHLIRSGTFFVAERDGRLAAAGGWSTEPPGGRPGTRGTGYVRHIAVDPSIARQGIGSDLVEHSRRQAREVGIKQLIAQSTLNAVPFYRSIGFVPIGDTALELPGGVRFACMAMLLRL